MRAIVLALTAVKTNTDLERVGDLAVNIAWARVSALDVRHPHAPTTDES